ncbi:MAG: hypothetical protein CL921_06205 [Deltaproteobacteria bacterium]|nr:hypothetical protein [Deltaproteobacteria bacterium]
MKECFLLASRNRPKLVNLPGQQWQLISASQALQDRIFQRGVLSEPSVVEKNQLVILLHTPASKPSLWAVFLPGATT